MSKRKADFTRPGPRGVDTIPSRRTHLARFVLLTLFTAGTASCAAATLPDARVIWVRDSVVYLAADSLSLAVGDRVSFTERGRAPVLAAGDVAGRLDATIRVARLTAGSLARVRRLERLAVWLDEALASPVLPRLRLGVPSARRVNPLFACSTLAVTGAAHEFVADSADVRRLLREPGGASAWPETLVVVAFDDAADQEIALERGDVDVAIFWPGELSARMRNDARWGGAMPGRRSRGMLAVVPAAAIFAPPAPALTAVNETVFRGDLQPVAPPTDGRDGIARPATGIRYEVDAAVPARRAIEGELNRDAPSGGPVVRIVHLDRPPEAPGDAVPLLGVRCAIVAAPHARRAVAEIGPDALADLIECGVKTRLP